MSTTALLLAISATVGAGACLAAWLRPAYDLRRAIRVIDRLQRQQRRHALVLDNLPEGLSFLAQCDLATTVALEQLRERGKRTDARAEAQATGLKLVETKVRDIHRRIYGATNGTPYTLPEEVDLGSH